MTLNKVLSSVAPRLMSALRVRVSKVTCVQRSKVSYPEPQTDEDQDGYFDESTH